MDPLAALLPAPREHQSSCGFEPGCRRVGRDRCVRRALSVAPPKPTGGFALSRAARRAIATAIAITACLFIGVSAAGAAAQPYGTGDYGGFRNVPPAGADGTFNGTDIS